jgi:hypothetical protein
MTIAFTSAGNGTSLLHEVAHARGGHDDVTRAFENDLTLALGRVASRSLACQCDRRTRGE